MVKLLTIHNFKLSWYCTAITFFLFEHRNSAMIPALVWPNSVTNGVKLPNVTLSETHGPCPGKKGKSMEMGLVGEKNSKTVTVVTI